MDLNEWRPIGDAEAEWWVERGTPLLKVAGVAVRARRRIRKDSPQIRWQHVELMRWDELDRRIMGRDPLASVRWQLKCTGLHSEDFAPTMAPVWSEEEGVLRAAIDKTGDGQWYRSDRVCMSCGKPLRTPQSRERGWGDECDARVAAWQAEAGLPEPDVHQPMAIRQDGSVPTWADVCAQDVEELVAHHPEMAAVQGALLRHVVAGTALHVAAHRVQAH